MLRFGIKYLTDSYTPFGMMAFGKLLRNVKIDIMDFFEG
jgi:hypothetical protein